MPHCDGKHTAFPICEESRPSNRTFMNSGNSGEVPAISQRTVSIYSSRLRVQSSIACRCGFPLCCARGLRERKLHTSMAFNAARVDSRAYAQTTTNMRIGD